MATDAAENFPSYHIINNGGSGGGGCDDYSYLDSIVNALNKTLCDLGIYDRMKGECSVV